MIITDIDYPDVQAESQVIEHPAIPKTLNAHVKIEYDKACPRSMIKKSAFHDDLKAYLKEKGKPITRAPAKNYKRVEQGVVVDPMVKALKNYSTNAQLLSAPHVQVIIDKTTASIASKSIIRKDRRLKPLTFEEVFKGEDGVRHKMKDSSAPGFTFSYLKKKLEVCPCAKGRRWLWQNSVMNDEYLNDSKILKALKDVVTLLDNKLKAGQRVCNINEVNLKDELRAFEKIKDGKSRAFFCQELPFLILTTMYFWPFVNWVTENRLRNGMLIGVNPYGPEWEMLYNHLKSVNDKGHFGDYEGYDKLLFIIWIYATKSLYRHYYGISNPILPILDLIMEEFVASIHVIPNYDGTAVMTMWDWANTSGNFITTVVNCSQ
jgi:hypothetical protein